MTDHPTDFIPMPEPTDEDKKFWRFYEQLEARWEQKIKESMLDEVIERRDTDDR